MKYIVAGGDGRFVRLSELLADEGNEVMSFAAENAALTERIKRIKSFTACDCVLLPLPAERGGKLNAPFSVSEHGIEDILTALPRGSTVLGGKLGAGLYKTAEEMGHRLFDYLSVPEFNMGNAAITAEAAVWRLSELLDKTLYDSRVLVVGYGRIGKLLSNKLKSLGCDVRIMSRSREAAALSGALGVPRVRADEKLSGFDAVVNTAPAPFAGELSSLKRGCAVLELASGSGGFDELEARRAGLRYTNAPSLPGKYAPESAAKLLSETVSVILRG